MATPVTPDVTAPSVNGTQGPAPLTWTSTASGVSRYAFVGVGIKSGSLAGVTIAVTYGGVAMTKLGQVTSNNNTQGGAMLFGLVNPATGPQTVSVTQSGGSSQLIAGSQTLNNVIQSGSLGTPVITFGDTSSPPRATVVSTTGDMVIDLVCYGTSLNNPLGTTLWVDNVDNNTAAGNAAMSRYAGAASVTTGFTPTAADWWGVIAVNVKQAASGTALSNAPSDPVGITDSVVASFADTRSMNDPVGISDQATAHIIVNLTVTLNDRVGITDTDANQTIDWGTTVADALGIGDATSVDIHSTSGFAKNLADPLGISDAVTAVVSNPGTGIVGAVADALLNANVLNTYRWIQLHDDLPGIDGRQHPAANTERQQVSWSTALGGTATSRTDLRWSNVPATETYRYWSAWNASSGGQPGLTGSLANGSVIASTSWQIDAGELVYILVIASN